MKTFIYSLLILPAILFAGELTSGPATIKKVHYYLGKIDGDFVYEGKFGDRTKLVCAYWNEQLPKPTDQDLTDDATAEAWYEQQVNALQPIDQPQSIAIPSSNSNLYYSVEVTDNGELFTALAHASPYDPAAHQQRITDELTRRQAIKAELNLTQAQIDAIAAYFSADVDALFSTLTANQRQFLKVQRAAVRYLLKQEVKELAP